MSFHEFNAEEWSSQQGERMKQTLSDLIPKEQVLYNIGHSRALPKDHYTVGVEGDVIALGTQFDRQAALGYFDMAGIDGNDELSQFSDEVKLFCHQLQHMMDKREQYLRVSKQRARDNPLNWPDWISYPPPQPRGWHYEDEYGAMDYYYDENAKPHYFGENFHIEDYTEKILMPYLEKYPRSGEIIRSASGMLCVKGFEPCDEVPTFRDFVEDITQLIEMSSNKIGQLLSVRRLQYLRNKFESYELLNQNREIYLTKINPHRDFYNVRKIDNNIDLTMCMSKKHLLNVINKKLNDEPNRVVYNENGKDWTLKELFEPYFADNKDERLNIDDLFEFGLIDRTLADKSLYIDDKNTEYDDIIKREVLLRIDSTFLRHDNYIEGEYLSMVLKQVLSDYEKSKYQFGELGVTLQLATAKSDLNPWSSIANWIVNNQLVSHNVKWLVRIARNYPTLKAQGKVSNFQGFIDLIFAPLFEVSIDPLKDINLHFFLTKTSGVTLLSNSLTISAEEEVGDFTQLPTPSDWNSTDNPPYGYYLFYIFQNLTNLNTFRQSKKLSILSLRPMVASVTEAHSFDSLATAFLFSQSIINGERLRHHPVLQYLYYLKQVGITVSPLCWNKSVQYMNDDGRMVAGDKVAYETHPGIDFFKTGMMVSLSTNKPLFSSLTRDPLIEEYSVAGSIHKLSNIDLCELCRTSVLISGFNSQFKQHWIGIKLTDDPEHPHENVDDFAIQRNNVPDMRLNYRNDCVAVEKQFIRNLDEISNGSTE
ncbi:AMD1 [Cyberlindnera jadinii]|uniref:AMD1 protein n=1 Tax=Cyberlindnera jadinii (strain ATCC 18201 / CBS 1600 / BCRC 20928 / JCM 3617 / NBRC 0987 / NRRL Y-1542) TaxID=983966 RepID=A0A0H5CAU8_CYBJN|nr:AMD1 [Cyberlindnera jadinii]